MTCSSCGHENKPERKFCVNCGAALVLKCSTCGADIDPGDRFCGECGTPLAAGAVPAAPPQQQKVHTGVTAPPDLERRLVSVLFCDLVGFTSFSETRDHEQVRETLGYYFDSAREIVDRYGGTVNKFIGDAVMATWGSPVAHEDDAERAVRAALDVVDAVAVLGEKIGEPDLKLRAGVLTGHAAVNPGAENEGMVIGDMVNTASRIQSIAEPGSVLVGESTYLGSKVSIAFEPAGEVTLKGKEEPVAVWRVLRVIAGSQGRDRSTGIEAPFVGRDGELRTLKELLHGTEMEARPRLVSIAGIAGVGKSRLIEELGRYVDGVEREFRWHEGRSPSYGDGITFWALAEMVRMRARIAEDDEEESARPKLAAALDRLRIEPSERGWIEGALCSLLGFDTSSSEEGPESLFPAWRTFFERVAETGPTIMIFQDLQWADDGTIAFIEHLLEWTRTSPMLIVTLFRPEFLERRPTWGVGQRNFASLHLDPLSDESMAQLLDGIVVDFPADALQRIIERAEGVPLYAIEMVRTMIDRGLLVEHDGHFKLGAELGDLEVPDSLHALIAARLDVLPQETRTIVQQASVLGQTFTIQSLASLAELSEIELTAVLKDLARRELMYLDVDPVSPERGQYGFVQSMIREVAYSTIAHKNALTMHVAAAGYFESLQDIEMASVVSSHYHSAYELAADPEEARKLADKALETLVDAADRAAALGSYEQALTQLTKAAELAGDDRKTELHQRSAEMALSAGRFEDADHLGELAANEARQANDRDGLFRMAVVRAQALRDLGRYDNEIEVLSEPLAWDDEDSFRVSLRAKALQAQACILADRSEEAIMWCDRTLRSGRDVDDPVAVVDALITRGLVISRAGRTIQALVHLMGAADVAERFELDEPRGRSLINVAAVMHEFDEASAYDTAIEGLGHSREIGNRYLEINHLANAFFMGFTLGNWDWIRSTGEEMFGENPLDHLAGSLSEIQCQLVLSSVLALCGDRDGPKRLIELVEGRGQIEDSWTAAEILLDSARISAARGDWPWALEAASTGAEHVDIVSSEWLPIALPATVIEENAGAFEDMRRWIEGRKPHDPRRDKWLAAITGAQEALSGNLNEAAGSFSDAVEFFRAAGERFPVAMIQLVAARVLAADEGLSRKPAEEARDILTELGAEALLPLLS